MGYLYVSVVSLASGLCSFYNICVVSFRDRTLFPLHGASNVFSLHCLQSCCFSLKSVRPDHSLFLCLMIFVAFKTVVANGGPRRRGRFSEGDTGENENKSKPLAVLFNSENM